MNDVSGVQSPDAAATKPHLLHAIRMAGRFVWRAAKRDFLLSVAAEGAGAVGLAGILLFGRQVVAELTADQPISSLGEVLPETIGLGVSLAISGLALVFVRRFRWLVTEEVRRHVQEEIIAVSTTVDYELYERQDFHDQLNRSNNQVAESSYQMAYDVLSIFNVLATSIVVILVLVRSVPEVLGVLVLIAIPSVIAARVSARLAYQTTYKLTPNDRLRFYLFGALSGKSEARELRVFGLGRILRNRWDALYDDRMDRIRRLVRRQVFFDGLGEVAGERGEQDRFAGGVVEVAGEDAGPVEGGHGFAGAGTAGDADRAVVEVVVDQVVLGGVEEQAPVGEGLLQDLQ